MRVTSITRSVSATDLRFIEHPSLVVLQRACSVFGAIKRLVKDLLSGGMYSLADALSREVLSQELEDEAIRAREQ